MPSCRRPRPRFRATPANASDKEPWFKLWSGKPGAEPLILWLSIAALTP
jgi:hypothetical protein